MRTLVIQHDHVSPPGPIGERFADRGHHLECLQVVDEAAFEDPRVTVDFPAATDFDALVVMGARWSAYDDELVGSWVLPELDLLREADAAGVPVLGICFGGQLLAAAHGGAVRRSSVPEVGWREVDSDDDSLLPSGHWFEWHFDRWDSPPGAVEVARNAAAPQAFTLRRNLAVQFHPELTPGMLQGWLDNGGEAHLAELGIGAEELMEETRRREAENRHRAHRLVDAFLDRVARSA